MEKQSLIAEIERFAEEQGIAPATVTSRAVSNSRLHARLKAGGGCTLDIAAKVLGYIADHRASSEAAE